MQVAVPPVKLGDTVHFKVIKVHMETETTLPKLQIKRMLKRKWRKWMAVLSQMQKDSALKISPQTRTERIRLYLILLTHQSMNHGNRCLKSKGDIDNQTIEPHLELKYISYNT